MKTCNTNGHGYDDLPSLIRVHDEQSPHRYSLKLDLRRLDESISRFQAAQETEKQIKAEEREGGRFADDEELLEGSLDHHFAVAMADQQASSSLLPLKRARDGNGGDGSGRKPTKKMTIVVEESELSSDLDPCQRRRNER